MSSDSDDAISRGIEETKAYRERIFVGYHASDPATALANAWETAKAMGASSGTKYRIVEQAATGSNPFTDHKVILVADA
jgi:hypothetical protein